MASPGYSRAGSIVCGTNEQEANPKIETQARSKQMGILDHGARSAINPKREYGAWIREKGKRSKRKSGEPGGKIKLIKKTRSIKRLIGARKNVQMELSLSGEILKGLGNKVYG